MQEINIENITTDKISLPLLQRKNIALSVLRLDKIHPVISGNKWFKLSHYIADAITQNKKTIVTFGGAWSNHIIATAAACAMHNLACIGLIRGEEATTLSPTLVQAKQMGMQLIFLSRDDYKEKKIPSEIFHTDYYLINEGGYGRKGAAGAAEILKTFDTTSYTHICCAAGTGTMAAGLLNSLLPHQTLLVFSVLKNYLTMDTSIKEISDNTLKSMTINHAYHFRGYAKHKPELLQFMNDFYLQTSIPTDFIYTGKLCYAVTDLIEKDNFPANSNVLVIHSGGLQGNASLSKGTLIF